MKTHSTIRIELTPEQKEQLQKLTGREVPVVKLAIEELEERLTPSLTNN